MQEYMAKSAGCDAPGSASKNGSLKLDYVETALKSVIKSKQKLLEAVDADSTLLLWVFFSYRRETWLLKRDFQKKVQETPVDKNYKDYLLLMQMQVIRERAGENPIDKTDAQR